MAAMARNKNLKCFGLPLIANGMDAATDIIANWVIHPIRRQSPPQKLTAGESELAVANVIAAIWMTNRRSIRCEKREGEYCKN